MLSLTSDTLLHRSEARVPGISAVSGRRANRRRSNLLPCHKACGYRLLKLGGFSAIPDHEDLRNLSFKGVGQFLVGRDVDRHHGVGLDEMGRPFPDDLDPFVRYFNDFCLGEQFSARLLQVLEKDPSVDDVDVVAHPLGRLQRWQPACHSRPGFPPVPPPRIHRPGWPRVS